MCVCVSVCVHLDQGTLPHDVRNQCELQACVEAHHGPTHYRENDGGCGIVHPHHEQRDTNSGVQRARQDGEFIWGKVQREATDPPTTMQDTSKTLEIYRDGLYPTL